MLQKMRQKWKAVDMCAGPQRNRQHSSKYSTLVDGVGFQIVATLTHYRLFYVPKGVFCRKSVFYLENNCHHMVMLHFLKTFHVPCETLHIRGYVVTAFSFFFKLKRVENGSFHNFISVDVISDFHVLLFDIYIYRNVQVNSLQQPYDLAYMRYNSRDCVKY